MRAPDVVAFVDCHLGAARVLQRIADERRSQDAKWGTVAENYVGRSPDRWNTILLEEVGEVARAILDREGRERLRGELIQVAAVAAAWVEALDAGGPDR